MSRSPSCVASSCVQDELIPLGYNWFIHNPKCRSVRVRYEAIPPYHDALPFVEVALEGIVRTLQQVKTWRASLVSCLHRTQQDGEDTFSVVLHVTSLHVEILDMVHLLASDIPVHLYIGDPLTTGTPFDVYSPEKLSLPEKLVPGDPIFCPSTERVTVFAAYLHSPDDNELLYGLTVGQSVVPQPGFLPHRRLLPRSDSERHQQRMRSSQLALHCLGRPLSSPAAKVVQRSVHLLEAERAMLFQNTGDRPMSPATDQRHSARLRQHDAELAILQNSLSKPHEYDVGHACAAEAIIRPCTSSHHRHSTKQSRDRKDKADNHTHLLSWAVMRMSPFKAADNPPTLQAAPSTLERGAAVKMQVHDPNLERPLAPFRDGVVNGAPATVIIDGYVAHEWAVFPAPGWNSVRFATRGDVGALVTSAQDDEQGEGRTTAPVAMLYAVPERGSYGLVTPLTTILRRIRDVTGMQLQFQSGRSKGDYV